MKNDLTRESMKKSTIKIYILMMLGALFFASVEYNKCMASEEAVNASGKGAYLLEKEHILDKMEADYYLNMAITVENKISDMSIHEKVCQMIFVDPENLVKDVVTPDDETAVTVVSEKVSSMLESYPIGGIMLKAKNIKTGDQLIKLISDLQSASDTELFVAVDEEGGKVNRLMKTLGTTYIDSMYTYKDEGGDTAFQNAETIGSDISSYGFNLDFAPVADVWSNPGNTVIGKRAYSDSFTEAAELIPYAVQGFHESGVMCTLKHFPGHGDTAEDSHYGSAYVDSTLDELRENEFLPFEAGIEAGADFVMVGHLIVTDVDDVPATLSKTIVTDVLKDELGFKGVIITDSFQMEAITDNYSAGEAAVMTVKAGVDMVLEPENLKSAVEGLEEAVASGEISEERIDESVRKILVLKVKNGLDI